MKNFAHHSLLIAAGFAAISLAAACDSGGSDDDDDDSGGTSGTGGGSAGSGATGGSGGSGSTTCTPGADVTLLPTADGWVDDEDACNDVGIQGAWYPYGDKYGDKEGDSKCTKFGGHMASECAEITSPAPPPAEGFPNIGGAMRTTGSVEAILPCVAGSMASLLKTSGCDGSDYSSMWGSGIGFDFQGAGKEAGGGKSIWDPDAHGVVGIAFTITGTPLNFRVEFPMLLTAEEAGADVPPITISPPTTDSHSAGAPYWGAQANGNRKFPKSNVMDGVENKIFFDDVSTTTGIESADTMAYKFDRHRMLGIQFHVVAGTASTYDFTVSNLRFLRTH